MSWEDILKRKRRGPDPPKNYGFTSYAGAGDAARKKREAILNDPEIKEGARVNKLKTKAEEKISLLEDGNKAIEQELSRYTEWPSKPEGQDEGVGWEKLRDEVSAEMLNMIEEYEKRKAYIEFLKKAIKSNFKGITDGHGPYRGSLYNIGSEATKYEDIEADIGNTKKVVRAKYNEIARRLGWDDKVMGQ